MPSKPGKKDGSNSPLSPREDLFQKAKILLAQYQKKTGIQTVLFDGETDVVESIPQSWSCASYYCQNKSECRKDHELVIQEAYRLGNTFIHLCHKNFVLWGMPLTREGKILGGAIAGYLLFEQNRSQLPRFQEDFPLLTAENAFISPKLVNLFSKRLYEYFKNENLIDVDLFKESEEKAFIQREIGEKLIENKQKGVEERHIIYEKQENLINSIKYFNAEDIRDNLNDVLSEIFLEGVVNIPLLKFRMLELFVLISRTMMEVGGDIDEFYQLTTEYTKKVENLADIYSFSLWLKEILNDFVAKIISARKKLGQVNRAIEYIRQNLDKKLTISQVAAQVALSESRFSQVFRKETGVSFPEYVNSVKIEKAKEMISLGTLTLTEIASDLSFYDQSYFTKTFRKHAGMTPKQFILTLKEGSD